MVVQSEQMKTRDEWFIEWHALVVCLVVEIVSETTSNTTRLETQQGLRPIKACLRSQEEDVSGYRKLMDAILKMESIGLVGTCHLQSFFALSRRFQ